MRADGEKELLYDRIQRIGGTTVLAALTLLIVACLEVFPTLGAADLKDWDEAIYASVAREMYRNGDVVHLVFNGKEFVDKPPLFMLLTALGYGAMGINEFSARFVSAVFGVGCVVLVFFVLRRLISSGPAFLASLFLLSHYQFLREVRHGRMETMVAFFITLAILALVNMREDRKWTLLFFAACGLAVLTKSAMGITPLFVAAPFLLLDGESRRRLRLGWIVGGVGLFLCLVVPWYLLEYLRQDTSFVDGAVGYHLIRRLLEPIEGHQGSLFFYLNNMSYHAFAPWAYLLPIAMLVVPWAAFRTRSRSLWLLAAWFWVIFGGFSVVVQTKLPWYVLSAYIPAAGMCAYLLAMLPDNRRWSRALREGIVLCTLSLVVFHAIPFKEPSRRLQQMQASFARHPSENRLTVLDMDVPSVHFYADRPVDRVGDIRELSARMKTPRRFFLIRAADKSKLDLENTQILRQTDAYVFFRT